MQQGRPSACASRILPTLDIKLMLWLWKVCFLVIVYKVKCCTEVEVYMPWRGLLQRQVHSWANLPDWNDIDVQDSDPISEQMLDLYLIDMMPFSAHFS